ncbi:THUMP domain-containing class I SAM-dependent RNA methyltransferase [Putridiphycobacter roseus]|nr:THUMP domain-containing protein [Putridiphycobacter roseus]
MQIVAKTFFGFEDLLEEELKALGAKNIEKGNRMVKYEGNKELLYRSNIWLRTAISVLMPIETFQFRDEDDLKKKLSYIKYSTYFSVTKSFAVKGAVNSKEFNHSQYPLLLLKDAIADHFRDSFNKRPDVDKSKPNVVFDLHIQDNECTVSLNSSGAPLFQRGYRKSVGEAPLNEIVAAALIMRSGWDRNSDLIDPFCGSGTIPIEAALMANDLPPMIERKNFGFKHWKDYDVNLFEALQDEIPRKPKAGLKFKIIGSDTDTQMILNSRENSRMLPVDNILKFEAKDFKDQEAPSDKGVLICNPPYGERLEIEALEEFYGEIGTFFKHKMGGFDCWIISSSTDGLKSVGLKPAKKIRVYNGDLECDFRKYEIFPGSLKEHKTRITEPRGRRPKTKK